jgi:hypothetical protein
VAHEGFLFKSCTKKEREREEKKRRKGGKKRRKERKEREKEEEKKEGKEMREDKTKEVFGGSNFECLCFEGIYTETKITETVDMTELEYELKRLKRENPGKKVTYFFTKDNPKGYKIQIKEAKIESDFFEREPKSKDIEKGEGIIAKTKKLLNFQKELKTLSKDMQDLAAEYKEAEGSDKDEILRSLKIKTAAKKELEKKIEQLEKYV